MYICQICHCCVPAGTKAHRLILETRPRYYPFRPKANRMIIRNDKRIFPDDPGGVGYEIVREVIACPTCAAQQAETGRV